MRVNQANSAPIQNADIGSAKKTDKTKAYEANSESRTVTKGSDSSSADISSRARDMSKAKQLATDAPDVREAKIADLKERIQNKTYTVSANEIADKLVDHIKMAK